MITSINEWKIRKINEGSYEDFIGNYGNEIRLAIIKLKKLDKAFDMYNKDLTPEQINIIQNSLKNYDSNVEDRIWHFMSVPGLDIKEIANFALNNYNKFGTEPQFVIEAIDEFCDAFATAIGITL